MNRPSALLVVVVAAVLGWPLAARGASPVPSARSAPGSPGPGGPFQDQVVLSGNVDVPRGSAVGEVVVFHGTVTVEGVVHGDVVVLNGPVDVSGQVSGSVVTLDGTITLRSSAQIGRDVLSGDAVSAAPSSYVGGRLRRNTAFTLSPAVAALGVLLASLMMAASTLILGLALILLAPRGLEGVAEAARGSAWVSVGWGVLLAVALPVVAITAMVTVIGLAVGLSLLLALAFLFLVGFTWTAWSIGRAIVPAPRSRWGAFGAGWGIAALLGLVPVLNVVAWVAGSIFGLGAMTVAIWRARHESSVVVPVSMPVSGSSVDLPSAPPFVSPAVPVPAGEPPTPSTPPGA